MTDRPCNFCTLADKPILETEHALVISDRAPVTRGHSLIILKRHEPELFGVTEVEWLSVRDALRRTKEYLIREFNPDGFNVGVNVGEAAGQTVPHLHVHVIPRYKDDVENPRGGVRNLMQNMEKLWEE